MAGAAAKALPELESIDETAVKLNEEKWGVDRTAVARSVSEILELEGSTRSRRLALTPRTVYGEAVSF